MVVFTLSGLWHGAQWTFVIWGAMNGVFLIVSRMTEKIRETVREAVFSGITKIPPAFYFFLSLILAALALLGKSAGVATGLATRITVSVFALIALVLGIVRMKGSRYAGLIAVTKKLMMIVITVHLFTFGAVFFRSQSVTDAWYIITHLIGTNFDQLILTFDFIQFSMMILLVVVLFVIHYIQEKRGSIRELIMQKPGWFRWALYFVLCSSILLFGSRGTQQFIYFRF
jgi:D-alanyl-lipoteichoic acid acyltransferase DltB (MBOAT superfamily)